MALKGRAGATLAGRYRLIEQLGEGGMGSVWKAEHLLLRSHVAVKIVDPDVARLEFNLARFLREAKTLASLRSPNVVQVLDFGSDGDTPYLVMELLQGQTLGRRLIEQGRLSLEETCQVLREVCAAMSLVHEQGLIHRDLKPENIFLCNVGGQRVTKVVDFGIAKSLRGDMTASMKTRTGHMLGTPSYMSPEQCRGLKDIDHRADLWALGVIAYECLVGKVPFEGEVLGDLLLRICMDPLPIPSQRARGALPPAFDAWFAKAVHRDREARFQSALELAISLSALAPAPSAPARAAPEPSRPSVSRVSLVPPLPAPRAPIDTETNTSVGVGLGRRVDRRARRVAVAGATLAMAFGAWALGQRKLERDAPVQVQVEGLRPAFVLTPKVIRPRVPTGRRWTPSSAFSGAGAPSSGASAPPAGAAAPAAGPEPVAAPEPASPPSRELARLRLDGASPAIAGALPAAPPAPAPLAPASNGVASNIAAGVASRAPASAASAEPAPKHAAPSIQPSIPPSAAPAPPAAEAPPAAQAPPAAEAPESSPPSQGRQLAPPARALRGTAAPGGSPPSGEDIRGER